MKPFFEMDKTSGSLVIRQATMDDLRYITSLQDRNRESVGHLPTPAFEQRIGRGTILLGILNGEPCGYLFYDCGDGIIRIPQACIQYDARRRHHGEALVAALLQASGDADECRLRCAADLEANLFWQTLGFVCTAISEGGVRRKRLINTWVKPLRPRLIMPTEIAVAPAAQLRRDAMYDETDFLSECPDGFADRGELEKIAWARYWERRT